MNPFVLAARGICQCVGRGPFVQEESVSVMAEVIIYVNPFVQGESVSVMAEVIICESFCAGGICQCDGRGYYM